MKVYYSNPLYFSIHEKVEEEKVLIDLFATEKPDLVIHLAAQAGVRYSIDNPRDYLESNIIGTFELLEAARAYPPQHMLLASTSSTYGANEDMPYKETHKADNQMSFYGYSRNQLRIWLTVILTCLIYQLRCFGFTVYGPWGRPDMALFKFTKAILDNETIDIYNYGNMSRDFTFIDDLVNGMFLLIESIPTNSTQIEEKFTATESKSPVAPFRVVNIGNSKPEKLLDFIQAIENSLGLKAKKNFMPIQSDVPAIGQSC